MNQETCPRGGRPGGAGSRRRLALAALLCPVLLAGCASTLTGDATPAAAPPVPSDPLVAFAAQATPGTESRIVLVDGSPALVRMTRSYFAASGRECRELLVGSGIAQRAQLVCAGEDGAWNTARPLLPGAGAVRR